MFGIPAWAIIAIAGTAALALLVLGACILAGRKPHARPPRHQRRPVDVDSHPRITRDGWLNGSDVIPRADVAGAPPWTVRDDPGATVIEGPWGPARQYPVDAAEPEPYLPAPELLDDVPPAPLAHILRQAHELGPATDAELDEDLALRAVEDQAAGLPPGHVQRPDTLDGSSYCEGCEERCTPAQPCVCCWLEDLSEDQAAELDEAPEPDRGPAAMRRFMREHPLAEPEPEQVLAVEAHAAQLREQDADARAYMERKAAELAELRRSLTGSR